jgi:hypothetical protein
MHPNFTVWVDGDPTRIVDAMSQASAPQHRVYPYRCESCGFIEMYAGPPEPWRS